MKYLKTIGILIAILIVLLLIYIIIALALDISGMKINMFFEYFKIFSMGVLIFFSINLLVVILFILLFLLILLVGNLFNIKYIKDVTETILKGLDFFII